MDKHKLLSDFLNAWPIRRLKEMTIEEYTNLNRSDSFCYWLESKTYDLGSIWGGSSFKFGIYKRSNQTDTLRTINTLTDGEYAWREKYGTTCEEAFGNIRDIVVKIAELSSSKQFDKIDAIDFGEATKWKIAFLYSNYELINTYSNKLVTDILDELNISYSKSENRYSLSQKILFRKKENEDFFEFNSNLWSRVAKGEFSASSPLKKLLSRLGDKVFTYFEILDQIVNIYDLERYDAKYYFSYDNEQLIFTVGQCYVWNLAIDGFKYISATKDDDVIYEFAKKDYIDAYLIKTKEISNSNLIMDRIHPAIQQLLNKTKKSGFQKNNKEDFQELVFNQELRLQVLNNLNITSDQKSNTMNIKMSNNSLNQILYGPPGTGKTYCLCKEYFNIFTISESSLTREQFLNKLVQPLTWWQVITLAIIDLRQAKVNDIKASELIKIKESQTLSTTVSQTIWGQLQAHTIIECEYVKVEKSKIHYTFTKMRNPTGRLI